MHYFKLLCMSPLLLPLCITICTTVNFFLDILLVVDLLIYSKKYFLIQQNKSYLSIYKCIIITSLIGFNIALQQNSFIASIQLTSKLRCIFAVKTLYQRCVALFRRCFNVGHRRCINVVQLSGQQLVLGSERFPVRVRLLAMYRGELSAVIARLMSKCL